MSTQHGDILRQVIQEALGWEVRQELWDYLQEHGELAAYAANTVSLDDLLEEIRRLVRLFQPPDPLHEDGPAMLSGDWAGVTPHSVQEEAVSRIVAEHVTHDQGVADWREFSLDNRLLAWHDVREWLISHIQESVHPTWYLDNAPIPEDAYWMIDAVIQEDVRAAARSSTQPALPTRETPPLPEALALSIPINRLIRQGHEATSDASDMPEGNTFGALRQAPYRLHHRFLRVGFPGESHERVLPVREGTMLFTLQHLAATLSSTLGVWTEAQATLFVLTGIPPLISALTADVTPHTQFPNLTRLTLHIDPTLSPREVADRYRDLRRYLVGEHHREITDKHAQLALFAVTTSQKLSLATRMGAWNEAHPAWAYTRESNFSRDMLQAQRRLLGAVLPPTGSGASKSRKPFKRPITADPLSGSVDGEGMGSGRQEQLAAALALIVDQLPTEQQTQIANYARLLARDSGLEATLPAEVLAALPDRHPGPRFSLSPQLARPTETTLTPEDLQEQHNVLQAAIEDTLRRIPYPTEGEEEQRRQEKNPA